MKALTVTLMLLTLAGLLTVAYGFWLLVSRSRIGVGTIVQTTFSGNHAYLTTALMGPRGELEASVSAQDALNMVYCDVPGSAGAYSSWFRPAGNASLYDPYTQASYSSIRDKSFTCNNDGDCNVKPWLSCGYHGNLWGGDGIDYPGNWSGSMPQWSADTAQGQGNAACGAPTTPGPGDMVCSFTGDFPDGIAGYPKGTPGYTGVCSATADASGNLPYVCDAATHLCRPRGAAGSSVTDCSSDATCVSALGTGFACNTAPGAGYCLPDFGEHVMLNTPWLAEGVVTKVHTTDPVTYDVQWTRVQSLYPFPGPQMFGGVPWDYTRCRFIADAASATTDTVNANATAFVLGLGSASVEVAGLPTASPDTVWGAVDATRGYGWLGAPTPGQKLQGLPSLKQAGGASESSAWNLQALGLSAVDTAGMFKTLGVVGCHLFGWTGGMCSVPDPNPMADAGASVTTTIGDIVPPNTIWRVPAYTIEPMTADYGNETLNAGGLVASMSAIRSANVAARPPHLQWTAA